MLVLNTNVGALNAQRMFNSTMMMQQTATERVASGTRVNSASDDAAALSIADSITAQIRGLNQGVSNTNDAISMAQTAEGALSGTNDILQRMRELSVQAATGTLTSDNHSYLQEEMTQLMAEMDQIAFNTNLNGKALLDGTLDYSFQTGANSNDTITLSLTQSADSTNLPPVEAPYPTVTSTISNFVNEDGDTMQFDIDGVSISMLTAGSADQTGNATALETALTAKSAELSAVGVTFSKVGDTIELSKTYVSGGSIAMSITDFVNIDNTPNTDYTTATISNFSNVSGDTVAFSIEGIDISFTATGTGDQSGNATALEAALTANSAALTAEGVSWVNNGSTVDIKKQGAGSVSAANDLDIEMNTGGGGVSSFDVTADAGSIGDTSTVGETRSITDGTHAIVDTFTNVSGETISFDLEGTTVSFSAAGTADQDTNASNMATAINAAGISDVAALAVSGQVYINKGDGTAIDISSYSGTDGDISRFKVSASSDSSMSGTGWIEEGPKVTLDTFLNTSGETVSFNIDGVSVSFTAAGSGDDTSNATNLKAGLDAQSAALTANNLQWKISDSGDSVIITRTNKSENIDLDGYTQTGTGASSMSVTPADDTAGTTSDSAVVLNDGFSVELTGFVNEVGETISFNLDGVALSFTATGTADQTGNATALEAELDTHAAELNALGYLWTRTADVVEISKGNSTNIELTEYTGSTIQPSMIDVNNGSNSSGYTDPDTVYSIDYLADGHSIKLGNFANTSGETISFDLEGLSFNFIATGTGDQAGNAAALYAALDAQSASLNAADVYLEYTGGDTEVRLIKNAQDSLNFENFSGSSSDNTNPPAMEIISDLNDGGATYETLTDVAKVDLKTFTNVSGETISFTLEGTAISFTAAGTADQDGNATALKSALDANSAALSAAGLGWDQSAGTDSVTLYKTDGTSIDITDFSGSDNGAAAMQVDTTSYSTLDVTGSDFLYEQGYYSGSLSTLYDTSATITPNTAESTNYESNSETAYELGNSSISVAPDTDPTSASVSFTGDRDAHLEDMSAGFTITATGTSTASGTTSDTVTLLEGSTTTAKIRSTEAGVVADLDLLTQDSASFALGVLSDAIETISGHRATLGAFMNRAEHTIQNARTAAENLSASRSRMMDADYAMETAALAKSQILQQTEIAVMKQAHLQADRTLSLLRQTH